MDAIKMIAQESLKAEVPQFSIGDTVRVDVNIREGDREMCIRDRADPAGRAYGGRRKGHRYQQDLLPG